MSAYVVDASVAAKWFLDEDLCDPARRILNNEYNLHAPDFLLLEMDSIFWKRIRRGDISPTKGEEARQLLKEIPMELYPFTNFLDSAYEIANMAQRSVYDSLYMALAILLDAPMLTADRKLCNALKKTPFKKHITWIEDIK